MEELYNQLYNDGKYTKTFEDFKIQFGNPEKAKKLYTALNEVGDYTKSFDEFKTQFSIPVKTQDSASADPTAESVKDMGSQSGESLSAWQSIKNSFSNLGEQVGDVFEFWFDTNEEEGGGARSALDIATNSVYAGIFGQDKVDQFVKEQGEDSWMSGGMGTKSTLESIDKFKKEQLETKETLGIIESAKNGDIGGAFAGGVNAITSMLGSIIYGAGTLGTGFFMDYAAENFVEYNKLKAENLGVSFDELLKSGEADNAIPVGMGVISTALEFIGLGTVAKGTKGAIKGTGSTGLIGMGSKYLAEKLIYNKGARSAMRMFSVGTTEFTTEILQHATDQVNTELGSVAGTDKESKIFKTVVDAVTSQEGLEAGLQGFIGGGGMVAGSYSAKSMNTIRNVVDGDKIYNNINELSDLRKQYNLSKDKSVKEGIQIEINKKESNIADSVVKGNEIYNSLNNKQISEIESLTDLADAAAYKITELNKKLRRGDISNAEYEAASSGFKAEYDTVRQSLIDMELEKNIASAETIASEKGLNIDVKSSKEVEDLMNSDKVSEKNRKSYFDNKNKGFEVSAFVIGNDIVIDRDIARKTGSINAGMHEVLHPILNKLVGDAKKQGKIVNQFRKAMTSSQRRFVDAEMKSRGYTGKKYNTEYVNVFSDALRKKQINYDKTLFEKIGDAIVGVFKPIGYTNIGFESGKDVYNFIKEFDESADQGKLTEKAAAALENVDLSDAGLTEDVAFSKSLSPEQTTEITNDITTIKQLAEENAAIAAKFGKEPIKGGKQTRLEQKVLTSLKPVIDKVITNRTKALYDPIPMDAKKSVSRQDFQDSMRSDIETMVLNEYNGAQDIEKFLVNRAYLRANDLAKRLGIEEKINVSLDALSPEGKETIQIASDYSPETTMTEIRSEENRKKKLVDPRIILGPERSKAYTEAVGEAIADMVSEDFSALSFSKLKDLAPAITADWWRTTVKKVTTPAANLASAEIPHMQRLIIKHADMFISMLPEGAILEGETAREELIGTGVGVPRKLQQAFYDKGERTSKGAGLIPFNLKRNITKEDFYTAFGINKDETLVKITGKDPRAQTILALIRLYGQITTNTAVRELAELTGEQKADIRAGAAQIQFSRAKHVDKALNTPGYADSLFIIQFSKASRDRYEKHLKKKRPDLENPSKAVDQLFEWADKLDVKENKKAKYKNLALYYMANGYLILPEDGYKVVDAIKTGETKKVDPYSFKNPNELLAKYDVKPKIKAINPDTVETLSNKKELNDGITIYSVEESKEAQADVRKLIDSNWGENANPWCLAARDSNTGNLNENTWKLWKHYGENKRIAFKNNKLLSFWADGQWWDRMDKSTKKLTYLESTNDSSGLKKIVSVDVKNNTSEVVGYKRGDIEGKLYEEYNANKELISKTVRDGKNAKFYNNYKLREDYQNFINNIDTDESAVDLSFVEEINGGFAEIEGTFVFENIYDSYEEGEVVLVDSLISKQKYDPKKDVYSYVDVLNFGNNTLTINKRAEDFTVYNYNGKKYTFAGSIYWQPGKRILKENFKDEAFNPEYEDVTNAVIPLTKDNNIIVTDPRITKYLTDYGKSINKATNNYELQFSKEATPVSDNYNINENDRKKLFKFMIEGGFDNNKIEEFLKNKKVSNDDIDTIKEELTHEGILEYMQDLEASNKGFKYEIALKEVLNKISKEFKVKYITGKKGDLIITRPDGSDIKIEVKLNEISQIGSATISLFKIDKGKIVLNNFEDIKISKKINEKNKESLISSIKANEKYINNLLDIINEINKNSSNKITVSKTGHLKLPQSTTIEGKAFNKSGDIWALIKEKNEGKAGYFSYMSDQSIIEDFYSGIDLIEIGGYGMYAVGKESKMSNTYSALNAETKNVIRPAKSGTTLYFRLFPNLNQIKNVKENSLGTKKGIEKIGEAVLQASKTSKETTDTKLDKNFNKIIENSTKISSKKTISEAKSKMLAKKKGRWKFFVPPSAEDFSGLMYKLLGKGEVGNKNSKWFKENLFDPYAEGIRNFESYKQQTIQSFRKLKKSIKNVPKGLNKTNETGFTNDVAVRVYLWNKKGYEIPGLDKNDTKELVDLVNNNEDLKNFAEQINALMVGYAEPDKNWLAGTITTDVIGMINSSKREEFLQQWQENADAVFTKDNINKLRAAFGEDYVEALKDMLYRMKSGRNRPNGSNKLTNQFMNWVNDSVGTIMFFNTRSALLQTLSIANFINWGDNNPIKAAKAFSNQKQFWGDFAMIFNSDFLKQRRSGLKTDVNADDIASAAETATNKAKAALSSILKMGFLPTQIADSFAIAMGGASFYRNRIDSYIKEGLSQKEAENKAFLDFQEVAEETQQSSRPDRISQQQASPLGRIILAFANTPMQYMRLTKKAILDLKNRRGDVKTNVSKIIYYTAVQNIIFSSLQSALFAALFDDDDEELINDKQSRIANSMLDTLLRGMGVGGAVVSTIKNIGLEIDKQSKKPRPDYTQAAIRSIDLSPPISSKLRKLMSAGRAFSYKNVRSKMKGYSLENPAFYAGGQIISATTNIPLDRAIKKADNIRLAMDNDTKLWQKIALALGYSSWDVGIVDKDKNKGKKGFGKPTKWKNTVWKTNKWKNK